MEIKLNTFVLFENQKKGDNPNAPDMNGKANVNGLIFDLSGWSNTGKESGKKYLAGQIKTEWKPTTQAASTAPVQQGFPQSENDGLPF